MAISLWFVKNQDSIKPWTTVVLVVVAQCLLYIYAHKWGPLLEKKAERGLDMSIPPTWPWKRIFVVSSIKLEIRILIKRFNSQSQRISPVHHTLHGIFWYTSDFWVPIFKLWTGLWQNKWWFTNFWVYRSIFNPHPQSTEEWILRHIYNFSGRIHDSC